VTINLRPYQDTLVAGARKALAGGCKRLLVQSPAGSGKTVTASFMVQGVVSRGMRAMFMVHREELARQAAKTLRGFGIPVGYVMASMTMDARQPVMVAMVDTLRNRLEKVPVPNVLFVDECHHAVSASWAKIIDYYVSKGAVVVGLSATPQRLDGRPLQGIFDDMVLGPSVKELIDLGALADYDYYAPPSLVDLSAVKSKYGDYSTGDLAEATDKPAIIGDAVDHYKRLMPGERAIAFGVNVVHSQHIAAQFEAAGIPARHLDGETPPAERMATIAAFARGDIKVMSNVSLFGEGFDVPSCSGVIMLRATQSLSLHIQVCGRAMRTDPDRPGKRAVLIDHVGNVLRHGLPDDDREWTLDGRKKRPGRKKDADEALPIKQCPKCYFVHQPEPACPSCGHVYEAAARQMEQVDGELRKLTSEDKQRLAKMRAIEVAKAKTLEELVQIEKDRGYKPGWARAVHGVRQKKALARAY